MARVLPSSFNIQPLHVLVFQSLTRRTLALRDAPTLSSGLSPQFLRFFPRRRGPGDFPPSQITFSCEPPHCPRPALFVTMTVVLPLVARKLPFFGLFPFRE